MESIMTITEGLAEIKLINNKINKKTKAVIDVSIRNEKFKDPYENEGGSAKFVQDTMQTITDLAERKKNIRMAIQLANEATVVKIGNYEMTIAEWLIWRRETLPSIKTSYMQVYSHVKQEESMNNSFDKDSAGLVISVDAPSVHKKLEELGEIEDEIDGKLSMINATTTITIE